ncbi:hypothetical protein C9374_006814 [Naegleria lovaniensis]|uniref:Uncharacterized protein n=1 Tax=Naegleria lovaniensis TaxID=51637 RepID=A0AA88H2C3_NAELO|nr:uncharacterized protein C9374_006814 [Naegleria lovaniensis]KAG2393283.1 hypothetical protein C9374_006814 [Naegleria lovaniensis]
MSFLSSLFTSTEEQIQQEFDLGIQPLRSRKWAHFNWSHILLDISGPFHSTKCLPKETFREILQFNDMEMLIGQIFSLLYVAADRCKESVSPKAQLTLRNGLVLIYQMMKNYVDIFWEQHHAERNNGSHVVDIDKDDTRKDHTKENGALFTASGGLSTTATASIHIDPPHFQNDFYKNMLRLLLMSGDERVFREDVIECSNFMLAFLLSDRIYGPLFLMYVNELRFQNSTLEALFFNSLDRLLCYQKRPELHICLPYVYSILWSLFSYSNFNNRIFLEMIPQRRNENKNLSSLLSLFLLHVKNYSVHTGSNPKQTRNSSYFGVFIPNTDTEMLTRHEYSICNYALQMLLIFTLNNPEFRCLFFDHAKSVPLFWDMLLSRVSQNLNKNAFFKTTEDQQWLKQSILIMRLFDKKEAIISGRLFSFIKWIAVISTNNVTKKQIEIFEDIDENKHTNDSNTSNSEAHSLRKEIMVFVDSDLACLTLRMLLIIAKKNREVLLNELITIKDFSEFLMTALIVNLRTVSDMVTWMTPLCGKQTSETMARRDEQHSARVEDAILHSSQNHDDTMVKMGHTFRQIANIVISILIELILGSAPISLIEQSNPHPSIHESTTTTTTSNNNGLTLDHQSIASDMDSISDISSTNSSSAETPSSSSMQTTPNPETIEKNKQLLSLHRSIMKYEKSIRLARETCEHVCRYSSSHLRSGESEDAHSSVIHEEESDQVLVDNLIQLVAYAQYFKTRYGDSTE